MLHLQEQQLERNSTQFLARAQHSIDVTLLQSIKTYATRILFRLPPELENLGQRLSAQTRYFFADNRNGINNLEHRVTAMDPVNVLKRGYTITRKDGKVVKRAKDV